MLGLSGIKRTAAFVLNGGSSFCLGCFLICQMVLYDVLSRRFEFSSCRVQLQNAAGQQDTVASRDTYHEVKEEPIAAEVSVFWHR